MAQTNTYLSVYNIQMSLFISDIILSSVAAGASRISVVAGTLDRTTSFPDSFSLRQTLAQAANPTTRLSGLDNLTTLLLLAAAERRPAPILFVRTYCTVQQ